MSALLWHCDVQADQTQTSDTDPTISDTWDKLVGSKGLEKYTLKQNIQLGVDHWSGDFTNQTTVNFLDTPNSGTNQGTYGSIIPWFKFSGTYLVSGNNDVLFNLDYRYNKVLSGNLDQANLDIAITPTVRARIGVVPMRLNFCRSYEQDNPWIMEVSVACGYGPQSTFRATNAAPGLQLYLNTGSNDWMSSYQIGFYQPNLLRYDTTEYGYVNLSQAPYDPGTGLHQLAINGTQSDNKFSINYDGLDPHTGLEFKIGAMWAIEKTSQTDTGIGNAQGDIYLYGSSNPNSSNVNKYQIYFTSIRIPVNDHLTITPTYVLSLGSVDGNTNADALILQGIDPPGSTFSYQYDPGLSMTKVSIVGVEFKYGLPNNDSISAYLGASQVTQSTIISSPDSSTLPNGFNNLNVVEKKITSISYRKDLDSGFFYIVQGMYGWTSTATTFTSTTAANGGFLGVRLGYLFH